MLLQTVLADDEPLARQKLRQMLNESSGVEVVGEGASASEVLDIVRNTMPQLLFLDIRMPGMDGFALVDQLNALTGVTPPRVIFTTAYDTYALRAFDMNAVDYLLKPFTADRLRAAIERAHAEIVGTGKSSPRREGQNHGASPYTTRMVFKSRGRILFLPVSDIRWIGAEENYVRICTKTETHLLRQTMSDLEEKLDPGMFARVHRSAIVNLQYVKEVRTESRRDFAVLLVNGQKIPMSRSYHARILQSFKATGAQVA
ncbi:MAG TPA: LytTR family DNA-binding domain-containing protein [Acidobacteriaceae bacterium]|jgi:two-component system LytT family response regulator|nr:LytTR family DNA-binding domain-containing protein [Acidobacteriaceae bacterium]